MVDFRYHLVSIIAVFLALAVGIVLGTTRLNGYLVDNLRSSIGTLTAEKRGLESNVSGLRAQSSSDQSLVDRLGPLAVANQLTGRRVVLLNAPNAPSGLADQVEPLLLAAGATVSGTVQLRPDLLDPGKSKEVSDLVARVAPTADRLDLSDPEPVQRAATELAAALVLSEDSTAGISATSADTILAGFRGLDLIDVPSELGSRADLAVMLTGGPLTGSDPQVPAARARALLSIAAALDAAGGGAVVAGALPSLQDGGVLKALRADDALSERVSSVDGIDRPQGRVALAFTLREQGAGGSGAYGSGAGAEAPLPSLPIG